jgi:Uma2 family endonuclease
MTAVPQHLTVEEFVAWSQPRPERHWELLDGVPRVQQSQTSGHARHVRKLTRLTEDAIADAGLELSIGNQGLVVKVGPSLAFEPDIVVFRGPMDDREIIARDPIVVAEVLSPSTARKDLTVKVAGYFQSDTILHYLMVDWETHEIVHYQREGAALLPPAIIRDGRLQLDAVGLGSGSTSCSADPTQRVALAECNLPRK